MYPISLDDNSKEGFIFIFGTQMSKLEPGRFNDSPEVTACVLTWLWTLVFQLQILSFSHHSGRTAPKETRGADWAANWMAQTVSPRLVRRGDAWEAQTDVVRRDIYMFPTPSRMTDGFAGTHTVVCAPHTLIL